MAPETPGGSRGLGGVRGEGGRHGEGERTGNLVKLSLPDYFAYLSGLCAN